MNSKNKNQIKLKKTLILTLSILFIALTVIFLFEKTGVTNFYNKDSQSETQTDDSGINYGPPTEQEANAGNIQKEIIVEESEQQKPPSTSASVVIVDASQYENTIEVRAFISNILEEGMCSFVFTKPDQPSISKETKAYPDASTTPCLALTVPRDEFTASGDWQLTVTFNSSNATGSASQGITLQ